MSAMWFMLLTFVTFIFIYKFADSLFSCVIYRFIIYNRQVGVIVRASVSKHRLLCLGGNTFLRVKYCRRRGSNRSVSILQFSNLYNCQVDVLQTSSCSNLIIFGKRVWFFLLKIRFLFLLPSVVSKKKSCSLFYST